VRHGAVAAGAQVALRDGNRTRNRTNGIRHNTSISSATGYCLIQLVTTREQSTLGHCTRVNHCKSDTTPPALQPGC
jgi:hypothetical protein